MIDFATDLYFEHISEASFLYEQRLSLLDDPEFTWLDIEDFENRFEADKKTWMQVVNETYLSERHKGE